MSEPRLTRRGLLAGGVAAAGALAGCSVEASSRAESAPSARADAVPASAVEPLHGVHPAGIATPPQAAAVFAGFDLRPGVDREAVARMMRLLTDDARRLTAGRPALADTEPELAAPAARLTITFGFGPGLFAAVKEESPVRRLPRFRTDRLE